MSPFGWARLAWNIGRAVFRQQAKARDMRDANDSLWELSVGPPIAAFAGKRFAALTYDDAKGVPIHLQSIEVKWPRRTYCWKVFGHTRTKPEELEEVAGTALLEYDRELRGRAIGANEACFYFQLPPKPWWVRRPKAKLVLKVNFERIDAYRRQEYWLVTSAVIDWPPQASA